MARDLEIDVSPLLPGGGIEGEPPVVEFMGDQRFEVVGVFASPIADVPFISGQAIMPLTYFEETYKQRPQIMIAHLDPGRRAEGPEDVEEGRTRCREIAPAVKEAVPRLVARTMEDYIDSFKQIELIDTFSVAIALLAAVVSAIGVANTMLMSVFDRTREIGLLRAIGWSRGRIVRMIEAEGLLLSIAGGLLGLPVGVGLIQASKLLVQLGWLDVKLDPPMYGISVGVACLIGLLGSLYPALRAASLQPTEALRYE
jgi:hypothetical protein